MDHVGGARGLALGACGATHGWLRGCEVLLTSYPASVAVVGLPAVLLCLKTWGIPAGVTARGANIAGLPLKSHLADGGMLMRG